MNSGRFLQPRRNVVRVQSAHIAPRTFIDLLRGPLFLPGPAPRRHEHERGVVRFERSAVLCALLPVLLGHLFRVLRNTHLPSRRPFRYEWGTTVGIDESVPTRQMDAFVRPHMEFRDPGSGGQDQAPNGAGQKALGLPTIRPIPQVGRVAERCARDGAWLSGLALPSPTVFEAGPEDRCNATHGLLRDLVAVDCSGDGLATDAALFRQPGLGPRHGRKLVSQLLAVARHFLNGSSAHRDLLSGVGGLRRRQT